VAGEWIKVRTNLWDDPRVAGLAEKTKTSEATVIGALYWLWATADEHSEDGLLPSIGLVTVDRKTGVKGISVALRDIGWLEETEKGVRITRFDEHNGTSAKTRAQTAKRVSTHKANAKVTPPALPGDDEGVTGALPRIRRREDKSKSKDTPIPPEGGEIEDQPKRSAIALRTFLAECKESGEQPIPNEDPVFAYAEKIGLPVEFLALQWDEFKDRYRKKEKRYKDWRQHFGNSVRGNWFKLWYADQVGQYALTTQGIQAQRAHKEGS
jgi:hypothetical protein